MHKALYGPSGHHRKKKDRAHICLQFNPLVSDDYGAISLSSGVAANSKIVDDQDVSNKKTASNRLQWKGLKP